MTSSLVGSEMCIRDSIVAGCSAANHYARAYLYEALDKYHHSYLHIPVFQFVDDMTQRAEGTRAELLLKFPGA
eukprot:3894525-Prorocentrum_lima.AAC.1